MRITEPVHINTIRVGDIVHYKGHDRTICKKDLHRNTFMGTTLFGDSHNLGTIPVILVTFTVDP